MHIRKNVIWKRREDGSMLLNTKTSERIDLNSLGSNVFLSKYVNLFSIDEITESLSYNYKQVDPEEIRSDVSEVIHTLETSNLLTDDPTDHGFINLIELKDQLDSLILEVTGECNLNCAHCLESGERLMEELPTSRYLNLAKELSELKVYRVVLTGGEPLMRSDIAEIIHGFSSNNVKAIVFTNGHLLTEKLLTKLQGENVFFRFSLDGADSKTHDELRGYGSFLQVMKAIQLCKDNGFEFGLSMSLHQGNFDQFFALLDLADALGASESEISEIRPQGNAVTSGIELLTKDQLVELRVLNLQATNRYEHFRKGMGFSTRTSLLKQAETGKKYPCNAGVNIAYIDASGNVYPCLLFKDKPEFFAGSIKTEELINIWTGAQCFKPFRSVDMTAFVDCSVCDSKVICSGGCRALAMTKLSDYYAPMTQDYCRVSLGVIEKLKKGELNEHLGQTPTNSFTHA